MTYTVIGNYCYFDTEEGAVPQDVLYLRFPMGGKLRLGGYVYENGSGVFRIPVSRLTRENSPVLEKDGNKYACEGFLYQKGRATPAGMDPRGISRALVKENTRLQEELSLCKRALRAHEIAFHDPEMFG